MPGLIDTLRFVHTAIQVETEHLESRVREATRPEDVADLGPAVDQLAELVDFHTRGEELGMFPPLREKWPTIDETYILDHEDERKHYADIKANIERCGRGDAGALAQLRRQTVALATQTESHIRKENTLILPFICDHFSPPEQGEMVGKIISTIPQEKMAAAVPWIIDRQPVEAAEAYVRALMKVMPAPAFEAAKGWIASGCREHRVAELRERIEELRG